MLYLCEEVLHRQLKWNGNTWGCSALPHNFDLLVTSFYELSSANHEFLGSMTVIKETRLFWLVQNILKIGIWDLEFVKPHAMKSSSYTTWKCRNFFMRHSFLSTIASAITNDLHWKSVLISISIWFKTPPLAFSSYAQKHYYSLILWRFFFSPFSVYRMWWRCCASLWCQICHPEEAVSRTRRCH